MIQDIKGCTIFSERRHVETDATIIIGKSNNNTQDHQLLCLRWNHQKIKGSKQDHNQLFQTIVSKFLKRDGMEAWRFGGSGGKTQFGKNMKKLLHYPGNFPRQSKGVKLVQGELSWHCTYIATKGNTPNIKYVKYAQPQIGGWFQMKQELFEQHEVLADFQKLKADATKLLQKLNFTHHWTVCKEAVQHELALMQQATEEDESVNLLHLAKLNKHTVVCYPVGFHQDFFKEGPSLENRICFVYTEKKNKTNVTIGRGGKGPKNFVWGLLDW